MSITGPDPGFQFGRDMVMEADLHGPTHSQSLYRILSGPDPRPGTSIGKGLGLYLTTQCFL